MEKSPLVTIVIVSFNTKKLLLSCISSIQKWVNVPYEIIIVDNASKDGSVTAVNELRSKNISIIQNKENVGFAKANNQAFKESKGEYILLLNSDTYLTENCISPLTDLFSQNKKLGVVSCQLKNADGTLQPTGGYFPTILRLFAWMSFIDDIPLLNRLLKPVHPSVGFYSESKELDWVTGAFFMFPRTLLKKVNGLDEEYFMYVEELDFCYRVKNLGYSVYYFHENSLVHLGRASSTNEFAIRSEFQNIALFYKKHFSKQQNLARLLLKAGCILRIILFGILGKSAQKIIYEKTFAAI